MSKLEHKKCIDIKKIPSAIGGSFATCFLATFFVRIFFAGMLEDGCPALAVTDAPNALRLPSSLTGDCGGALLLATFLAATLGREREVS